MEHRAEPHSKICIKCGEVTSRYKYCDDCAVYEKMKAAQEHHKQEKGVHSLENTIAEKKYRNHFRSSFTWDQPNDLLC